MSAARWAWERGEAAGAGTGTLPQIGWTFRPLDGVKARAGVAGVETGKVGSVEDERYVLALLDQGAVAIERAELAAQAADAEALRRSDRLRSALLNSISHDLRTPLATVLGAVTTLLDLGDKLERMVRRDLLVSIREEAERLNRYVGDLLDMTRLEGGGLEAKSDLIDVRMALEKAIERVSRRLGARKLERDFAHELSMVKADPNLLEQACVNILENAIGYSPDGSRIEVAVYEDPGDVVISIEDQGRGIPKADLEKVFDKFRRLDEPSDRSKGVGLGLSIAKGFIEAMGGRIAAVSPVGVTGGTRMLISLPKTIRTHQFLL
jgi:two-component system sensor histidine kinase KdpD